MMRKLLTLLIVLAIHHGAGGQGAGYVQVKGSKSCYANGSVSAAFVNQSGGNQLPLLNGSVFPTTGVTNFDSFGDTVPIAVDLHSVREKRRCASLRHLPGVDHRPRSSRCLRADGHLHMPWERTGAGFWAAEC
jgi:hypothetical protein